MGRKRFTTTINEKLLHALKIRAAEEQTDINKILDKLIEEYLRIPAQK